MAEFVRSGHAQVQMLFLQPAVAALVSVHEDCIVLAAIFCGGTNIAVVPALTAFGTVGSAALAFSEAWS